MSGADPPTLALHYSHRVHRDPHLRSRRSVLVGGALGGAVALTGCGWLDDEAATPPGTVEPTVAAVDADSDVVEEVGRRIAEAGALADRVARDHRPLRATARPFADLHDGHLAELDWEGDVEGPAATDDREQARARLLESEERLQAKLVRASVDAESGALAQVLASMAAAVAQQRAVTG